MKASLKVLAALTLLVPAFAGAGTAYVIDPGHSSVDFSVRHMVSQVRGNFHKFQGTFEVDDKDPSKSKVAVTVETASIDTGLEKRDNHLRSEDFFWAEKYPTAEFVSTKVSRDGKDKLKVEGTLTLRGVSKPVVLHVQKRGAGKTPWGTEVAGYSAKTLINRQDWGLKWNKALETGGFLVGDEVSLEIEIEASVQK